MKSDDKNLTGIVINCYDHDAEHRILTVLSNDLPLIRHFFFIPTTPQVDFGDIVQMNFAEEKYYVYRGNSRLSYKIIPLTFPGSLLIELINEHLNEDSK